jgi:hypothetical protein
MIHVDNSSSRLTTEVFSLSRLQALFQDDYIIVSSLWIFFRSRLSSWSNFGTTWSDLERMFSLTLCTLHESLSITVRVNLSEESLNLSTRLERELNIVIVHSYQYKVNLELGFCTTIIYIHF